MEFVLYWNVTNTLKIVNHAHIMMDNMSVILVIKLKMLNTYQVQMENDALNMNHTIAQLFQAAYNAQTLTIHA